MQLTEQNRLKGLLFISFAVLFWGGSASFAKYLFTQRLDTLIVTQMRTSLSFVLLSLYFAIFNRSIFRVNFKDLFQIALLGIVGIAVTNFTYYFTVKESTVATAILVQYTAPVWVMIYAVFVSKNEEFNFIKLLALVFSMTGCFFAVSGGSLGKINLSGWSAVTGICSAFTYAFMILLSKRLTRTYSVWTMLIYAFGFALLFWLTINPPWAIATRGYSTSEWAILWLFAVVSILIPHSLFVLSLKYLEASTAGIASTMEPVVAIVIAYITLGETLNGIQVIGAIVVIVSLLLLQVKKRSVV